MDPSALFADANRHYVNEEYEEALKHYTIAVTLQEDCGEFYACRAAAYLKLGKFAEALADADQAIKLDARSHMALHWKGIALFYMGDFAAAKLSFEESLRIAPAAKAPRSLWRRKCDAELSGSTLPLGGLAAEVSRTTTQAAAPAAAAAVPVSAPPVAPAPAEAAAAAVGESAPSKDPSAISGISGRKPLRREWYQNASHVFITIFAKGVDEQAVRADFQEKELSLTFPVPGSTDDEAYTLDLELFDAVDAEACRYEVSKVKVELVLAKKSIGFQWGDLERKEEAQLLCSSSDSPAQPAYPTSNKQKRDWSKIDNDVEAELKNEKPEGDQALNKLFREIYERADDDTRRAMNKSFQTSGGTVLSTNWGEVAKNDYEGKDRPTPPEGQDWRDTRTDKKAS